MKKFTLNLFLSCLSCFAFIEFAHAQAGEWTWMRGSSTSNSAGTFGTMGVSDPSNDPSALYEAFEWTDQQGNLWLFGGDDGNYSYVNALWKYDPATNEWTWMKGSSTPNQPPSYGTQGISSPTNDPGGRFSGATWIDAAGNLYLFGGYYLNGIANDLWKYDISTNEWTWMKGPSVAGSAGVYGTQGVEDASNYPGYRCEVNAAWTDNDGNLWLFGGGDNGSMSLNDLWRYNPATNNWTWMKGSNVFNSTGVYGTMGVSDPSNTPGARMIYTRWKDLSGNFWFFGGRNSDWNVFSDLWKYDVATNEWTWMSGTSTLNASGTYGSTCNADSDYLSSCRTENRAVWTDDCGNFWFFGGANNYYSSYFNDLWLYNTSSDEWSLISGTSSPNGSGVYGTQGVADPANIPPGLWGGSSWTDHSGNLWMFGGSALWGNFKNALWKFVPDPNCGGCAIQNSTAAFGSSDTDVCEKFCVDFFDSSANNPLSWLWSFPGGNPSSSTIQNPTSICYDEPGVYDVTLITTNASGSDTLTLQDYITVYSTPPFPSITQNGYTLTSSGGDSYQWQLNAIDIPGATNQSYEVLQTGFYTVVVSDSNGCANSTTLYVEITGIDELSNENISVYPNPSNGNFIVEWPNDLTGEFAFDIVNALGQKIYSSQEIISSSNMKKEIQLHDQSAGLYFIRIKTHDGSEMKKILVVF